MTRPKDLTRRANHRHSFTIATIEPAPADRPRAFSIEFSCIGPTRNSTQPEPPQQTADSKPERRLGRSTYSVSPASVFYTGAPAVPFVSSDDANYSGGLLGMFAALAGSDPNQSAPSPDDGQEQANLQALEDRLTSTGTSTTRGRCTTPAWPAGARGRL
jgi:hypothetical protein